MSKKNATRVLIFFGVYEAERSFAAATLEQLLNIWGHYQVTIHIQDDASPSHVGLALAQQFSERARVRLTRLERSLGYHGTYERCLSFLHEAATESDCYDYVLRVDADIHLASRKLAKLFDPGRLPQRGLIGQPLLMRHRDFALWIADLAPVGVRRHLCQDGRMEHRWELRRTRPVWWSDIGLIALKRGFRGRFVPSVLQILAWPTLIAMRDRGWLARPRRSTGLIFQDDVLVSTMVHALGDPIVDIGELIPGWNVDLFLGTNTPIDVIRARHLDLLHPLKDSAWAHELRAALPLAASGAAGPDNLTPD